MVEYLPRVVESICRYLTSNAATKVSFKHFSAYAERKMAEGHQKMA